MTLHEVHQYLESLTNFERCPPPQPASFSLDRIKLLLKMLGNPQNSLRCIHIAGSKGKGSTCAFVAHILSEAGYKTGLYTSPHLENFKERVRILKKSRRPAAGTEEIFPDTIADEDLCCLMDRVRLCAEKVDARMMGPATYFEILTALALCYFREQKTDYAVLETGLGGRLDAVNVVSAQVCALTPIGLEHTQWLGNTLAAIAGEKAAIIKEKKQKVVIAPQPKEALVVIEARCAAYRAQPTLVGRDVVCRIVRQDSRGLSFSVKTKQKEYALETNLLGGHQAVNAATAIAVVEALGADVSVPAVKRGIKNVFWPGRLETVGNDPRVIVDCAHTWESAACLADAVKNIFPGKKIIFILGFSKDKDPVRICEPLSAVAQKAVFTRAAHPRASEKIADQAQALFPGHETTSSLPEALDLVLRNSRPDDIVIITGSIFLVAEARKIFRSMNKKENTSK